MDTAALVREIVSAWSKGRELTLILDGVPMTLVFGSGLSVVAPADCATDPVIAGWIEEGPSEGSANVVSSKELDDSVVQANVTAEIQTGSGVVRTESSFLSIDSSKVSLFGYGRLRELVSA